MPEDKALYSFKRFANSVSLPYTNDNFKASKLLQHVSLFLYHLSYPLRYQTVKFYRHTFLVTVSHVYELYQLRYRTNVRYLEKIEFDPHIDKVMNPHLKLSYGFSHRRKKKKRSYLFPISFADTLAYKQILRELGCADLVPLYTAVNKALLVLEEFIPVNSAWRWKRAVCSWTIHFISLLYAYTGNPFINIERHSECLLIRPSYPCLNGINFPNDISIANMLSFSGATGSYFFGIHPFKLRTPPYKVKPLSGWKSLPANICTAYAKHLLIGD